MPGEVSLLRAAPHRRGNVPAEFRLRSAACRQCHTGAQTVPLLRAFGFYGLDFTGSIIWSFRVSFAIYSSLSVPSPLDRKSRPFGWQWQRS
jgi:hypothetical protein